MSVEKSNSEFTKQPEINPLIRQVGEVTFIGVRHNELFSPLNAPSSNVMDVLNNADHLLMEGNKPFEVSSALQGYEPLSVATFVKRRKEKNIHPLEEESDEAALGEKYGMDKKRYILYRSYLLFSHLFNSRQFQESMTNGSHNLEGIVGDINMLLRREHPHLSSIGDEEMNRLLKTVFTTILDLKQKGTIAAKNKETKLLRAADKSISFLGTVRDYEVIIPSIRKLDKKLLGEKALVIGIEHVQPIQEALISGTNNPPKNWNEYVKELDNESRSSITMFDRLIVKNKQKRWYRKFF